MKHFFTFLLFLVSFSLFAQDTTHVNTYYPGGKLNERYVVNSKKEKNGEYIRYSSFGKKYISGQYKNGQPVGVWEYFSSDTLGILVDSLNFDTHKELFVDPLHVSSLLCGPRYFGGKMLENEYINHRIQTDFTPEEKAFYHGQNFSVVFTIDSTTMKPVGISIDDPNLSPAFAAKIITIVSEMPAWLPPVCVGKEEVWRFSVTFIF